MSSPKTPIKKSTLLQNMLKAPGGIIAPGVYDALSARVCEHIGFKALQHSGFGTSAVRLASPDIGLLGLQEMASQLKQIVDAVNIPVCGDCDTGFGNALNAYHAACTYIHTGAAGLFIEDQVMPKRCGHMEGKDVVSFDDMAGKLKAVLDAKAELDPDFVLIYRTDSLAVHGFDEALRRGHKAIELGVDMLFIEALQTHKQIETVAKEFSGTPLMLNLIDGGLTPLISMNEAISLGYKWVVPGLTSLFSAAYGMYAAMKRVYETNTLDGEGIISFNEFNEIVGLDSLREREKRYQNK